MGGRGGARGGGGGGGGGGGTKPEAGATSKADFIKHYSGSRSDELIGFTKTGAAVTRNIGTGTVFVSKSIASHGKPISTNQLPLLVKDYM